MRSFVFQPFKIWGKCTNGIQNTNCFGLFKFVMNFVLYRGIEEKGYESWAFQTLDQIFEFQAAQFVHVGRILLFNSRIDFDNFDLYF